MKTSKFLFSTLIAAAAMSASAYAETVYTVDAGTTKTIADVKSASEVDGVSFDYIQVNGTLAGFGVDGWRESTPFEEFDYQSSYGISSIKGAGVVVVDHDNLQYHNKTFLEDFEGVLEVKGTESTNGALYLGDTLNTKLGKISSLKLSAGGTLCAWGNTFGRALELAGGTIKAGGNIGFSGKVTVSADSKVNISENDKTVTIRGEVTGQKSIEKTGVGTLVLSGIVASGLHFKVSGGEIKILHNSTDRTFAAGINIASGATFSDQTDYKYHLTFDGALSGSGTLYSRMATEDSQGDGYRMVKISGSTKDFTGTWILENGESSNATGNRKILGVLNSSDSIFGGVVEFHDNASSAPDATKLSSVLGLAKDMTIGGLKGSNGTIVSATGIDNNRGAWLNDGNNTSALTISLAEDANYTFGGKIDSTIKSLTISGSGTQTLSGDNSKFTGGVTISGGKLVAAHKNALGSGNVTLAGGTLETTTAVKTSGDLTLNAETVSLVLGGALAVNKMTVGNAAPKSLSIDFGTDGKIASETDVINFGTGVKTDGAAVTIKVDISSLTSEGRVLVQGKTNDSGFGIWNLADANALTLVIGDGEADIYTWSAPTLVDSENKNATWSWEDKDLQLVLSQVSGGYSTLTLQSVPEPSAFGLLAGLGALALVASRRRRRA